MPVAAFDRQRTPRPLVMATFFAVVVVVFSVAAVYDLHDHGGVWRWFAVVVVAGVVVGTVAVGRGRVAEDTSWRGAMRRTNPWVGYVAGGGLLLNVAGPVAGGLATGFVIGMCLAALVFALRWWARARKSSPETADT
ncbi:MAG: hypothetical protein QOG34_1114 [Frankiaceae bacterium]|nr:hypothetical protein [Frankiaceae bacterium]